MLGLGRILFVLLLVSSAACAEPTTDTSTLDSREPVSGPTVPPADAEPISLVRVTDGDSLVIEVDGHHQRVRLVGINAPELGTCWGDEARERLETLLTEPVTMSIDASDRDQYDRMLRLLWTADGRLVNELLVAEGNALVVAIAPDVTHLESLRTAEAHAREQGLGLWAPDACGSPSGVDVGFGAAVFDPPGDDLDPVTGERVTVVNHGADEVMLADWELADEGPHRFRFPPGFALGPGEQVTVYSTCGDDTAGFLYWCAGGAVWSNGGDTAHLRDPAGNVVDSTGPFGDPPRVAP